MPEKYDFCGWASKNNLLCQDGVTIRQNAFADCDGKKVPLVWMHSHDNPRNVLGHAILKNTPEGVLAYGKFNNSERAQAAKEAVNSGDVDSLSIWANHLTKDYSKRNILHGDIKEVSLVLAGANPGAQIFSDSIAHDDMGNDILEGDEAEIRTMEPLYLDAYLEHSDMDEEGDIMPKKSNGASVKDIFDQAMSKLSEDEQRAVMIAIGSASESGYDEDDDLEQSDFEDDEDDDNKDGGVFDEDGNYYEYDPETGLYYDENGDAYEEDDDGDADDYDYDDDNELEQSDDEGGNMSFNAFDQDSYPESPITYDDVLSHDDIHNIMQGMTQYGTLKNSINHYLEDSDILQHDGLNMDYGISNIDMLFPDAKNLTNTPEFIKRETAWVATVMNETHHIPYTRIKSMFADITGDEARARGYITGKLKKEEVFSLLKRTTDPQTIYKKQKLDRDYILDITDFDVVIWIKGEMRIMLDEEIARAILVGDGRLASDEDHISEEHIRPIWKEAELFTIYQRVKYDESADTNANDRAFINAAVKSRKDYKGSGNPTLFTTEDKLTDLLLMTDTTGRDLFTSVEQLATKLRVSKIVTVPIMEGLVRDADATKHPTYDVAGKKYVLDGIIINLTDYSVGSDKGGQVSMFDDFDIDYNQQKYLIETRISGALTKPKSAIILEHEVKTKPTTGGAEGRTNP